MSIGSRYTISTAPPSSGPGFTGVVSSGLAIGAVLLFVGLAAAQAESNALTLPDSLAVASSDSLAVASSDSLTEAAPDTIVAVLPFANLTGNREAPPLLLPLVHQQLIRQGVSYRTALAIRPILRRHRIRTVGSISRSGAELLREYTGYRYLLIGSIDIFRPEGPEVGLSLRLLDLETMSIARAASASATGEDFAGLFGIGRLYTVEEVALRVVERAFAELGQPLLDRTSPAPAPAAAESDDCRRLVVVPFDNFSDFPYGGDVAANILLARLVQAGFQVAEPGFVQELFMSEGMAPRGQLELATLDLLYERLDTCLVVTGAVARFHPALGDPAIASPDLVLGARILDAAERKLVAAFVAEEAGEDSETMFELGRVHSLGSLAAHSMDQLVKRVESTRVDLLEQRESNLAQKE